MSNNSQIIFILGPSGVGKSTFGNFLKDEKIFLHIEADEYDINGMELNRLQKEWRQYLMYSDINPLKNELNNRITLSGRNGSVLTFSSNLILDIKHIKLAESSGIKVRYLYGHTVFCTSRFVKREKALQRGLDANHWVFHNSKLHYEISQERFNNYRIDIAKPGGGQISWEEVYKKICA